MEEREEAALKKVMEPLAEEVKQTFIKAIGLRVDLHMALAMENGAEIDDIPEIVIHAVDTATPITTAYFDKLGEVEKAHAYTKRQNRRT